MGAFDGYIATRRDRAEVENVHRYFPAQSAFSFFKGFGIEELKQLLIEAEINNSKTIYIPREQLGQGYIRLQTWYVRALIEELNYE